ncbi:UNVERIFIED_ORG: hypothetical protein ABIB52_000806 [Arthrobacter sp. UYCu721]
MTIISRENVRLPLHTVVSPDESTTGRGQVVHRTYAGTLVWNTRNCTLELVDPQSQGVILRLSGNNDTQLDHNEIRLMDVAYPDRIEGIHPKVSGAYSALRTLGIIINQSRGETTDGLSTIVELSADLGVAAQEAFTRTASVTLFKDSGKYYTQETWKVPVNAVVPSDMSMSPDFRRISGGTVLVDTDAPAEFTNAENWGFPHLFPFGSR